MMALVLLVAVAILAVSVQAFTSRVLIGLKMKIDLPPLPYPYDSLEPHLDQKTLEIHHDKHHAKYVNTANDMISGTDMENDDAITLLKKSYGNNQGLFNNAAQSFNHAFYWNCMKPNGGGKPSGKLMEMIEKDFGSFEAFETEFKTAGATAFGSGWAWLVHTPSGLKVTKTIGADNPLTEEGSTPLLTMDVWEHAYYLDYQNVRASYVENFLAKLVNWDFVNQQLHVATEDI